MVRSMTMKSLEDGLKSEKDPYKREQLKMLIEEMHDIYPDEDEIPEDPNDLFKNPNQWKKEGKKKVVMCIRGESGSGKTFTALSASHLTPKHIDNDFKAITQKEKDAFKKYLEQYVPFTPVWVIGTEASTHECLTSDDNEEYFSHANINYVECKAKGTGLGFIDHKKTIKNILIALYTLIDLEQGTIVLDSNSSNLMSQHEVVRRVIMKIPKLKRAQGVPTRHWFWRNTEQENLMLYGRIVNLNFIFTVKEISQNLEGGETVQKVRWHEETNRHLSSTIIDNKKLKKDIRTSTIFKCRKNSHLEGKSIQNMTLPLFMYNLFLASKKTTK